MWIACLVTPQSHIVNMNNPHRMDRGYKESLEFLVSSYIAKIASNQLVFFGCVIVHMWLVFFSSHYIWYQATPSKVSHLKLGH